VLRPTETRYAVFVIAAMLRTGFENAKQFSLCPFVSQFVPVSNSLERPDGHA